MIEIGGQIMTIVYIRIHAPKDRPINNMILVDQVRGKEYGKPKVYQVLKKRLKPHK